MSSRFIYRVFCGFFLGLSVFAPGISGSVIAIIMGIYHDLIRIVSNPFKQLKANVLFCMPLAIGAAISAVLFVITFKFLFSTYEKATYLLFVGLIAGNLPVIFAEIKKYGFQKSYQAGGIGAFAVALALSVLASGVGKASGSEGLTSGFHILMLSGFACGAAALVPGMSVSMILIITGVYSQLLYAAESLLHFDFSYLVPFVFFGLSAVLGLVLASAVIKFVFEKYPGFASSMVFGFMSGSLTGILIQSLQISATNFNWLLGGAMLTAGLCVSMQFVAMGKAINRNSYN